MLAINGISKSYGMTQVLSDVSLVLNNGQRLGLVGANGVGKSTLLKIIAGELEADYQPVNLPDGLHIGYLPQVVQLAEQSTIVDLIETALQDVRALEGRMRQLEAAMAEPAAGADFDAIMTDYGRVEERFSAAGGYTLDYRVDTVLSGLQVAHLTRDRVVATLSGGEQARLSLALLLLRAPDVLLLDEPTNHLDMACLTWLENYLRDYAGAALIVSHDRAFLNRTVTAILEIEEHSHEAKHYSGNYDDYLIVKAQAHRRWMEEYTRQQEEIKSLRHTIKVRARQVVTKKPVSSGDKYLDYYRQTRVDRTVSRRVASAEERLHRIEADPVPQPPQELCFDGDFDPQQFKGHTPLVASAVSKSYGGRVILDEVSLALGSRSRIVLVGPNGSGKSTLLNILAGREMPDSGTVTRNPQVRLGYLDQDQAGLDPAQTVLAAYQVGLAGTRQQHITQLVSAGLFRYEELARRVGDLSSGQQRKLQIARLIAERCNCLLLDEPTNYISFDVLEALEQAALNFPGPVVAVSHDRRFIQRLGSASNGGEVWELREGQLIRYLDGAEAYFSAQSSPEWSASSA